MGNPDKLAKQETQDKQNNNTTQYMLDNIIGIAVSTIHATNKKKKEKKIVAPSLETFLTVVLSEYKI